MKSDGFYGVEWTDEVVWQDIEEIVSANEHLFEKRFKEWLKPRLQFWKQFASIAFEFLERYVPYGYSVFALLRRTERKLGMVAGESYEYVTDLAHLLIVIIPEFEGKLWWGERDSHPVKKFISEYGSCLKESFYKEHPEFGSCIDDDEEVTNKNLHRTVFR